MTLRQTLLLTRDDLSGLLSFDQYVEAVRQAFCLYAEGKALTSHAMHVHSPGGAFHIKAGGLELAQRFVALKANGRFDGNVERFGIPNVHGVIVLYDGENGVPLSIMDSREITVKRTGAATAVAAKHLARPESSTATICGCGTQGRIQLHALVHVLPINKAFVVSRSLSKAKAFAAEMSEKLEIEILPSDNVGRAVRESDVCVTCTRSDRYFLNKKDVGPGTFIAAVGSDSPEKQELDPHLLISNKVVVDLLEQCAAIGELHHAIAAGMALEQVHAELAEVISNQKPGRVNGDEIIIFDSTGAAVQDVAAAVAIYEAAVRDGRGTMVNLV